MTAIYTENTVLVFNGFGCRGFFEFFYLYTSIVTHLVSNIFNLIWFRILNLDFKVFRLIYTLYPFILLYLVKGVNLGSKI